MGFKSKVFQKGFLLMILSTLFTSVGQLLWKAGAAKINFLQLGSFFNLPFLLGTISYLLGILLVLLAFKNGDLSLLYPIMAASYVWVSIASPFFFQADQMNLYKWLGVAVIIFSIILLGWGCSKENKAAKTAGAEKC